MTEQIMIEMVNDRRVGRTPHALSKVGYTKNIYPIQMSHDYAYDVRNPNPNPKLLLNKKTITKQRLECPEASQITMQLLAPHAYSATTYSIYANSNRSLQCFISR
jgi:hypothetical protein